MVHSPFSNESSCCDSTVQWHYQSYRAFNEINEYRMRCRKAKIRQSPVYYSAIINRTRADVEFTAHLQFSCLFKWSFALHAFIAFTDMLLRWTFPLLWLSQLQMRLQNAAVAEHERDSCRQPSAFTDNESLHIKPLTLHTRTVFNLQTDNVHK